MNLIKKMLKEASQKYRIGDHIKAALSYMLNPIKRNFILFLLQNCKKNKNTLKIIFIFAKKIDSLSILYIVGTAHRLRGEFQNSFDIFFYLISRRDKPSDYINAFICEKNIEDKKLYDVFIKKPQTISKIAYHILECNYANEHEHINPNWTEIELLLKSKLSLPLINTSIVCALAHKNLTHVNNIKKIIFKHLEHVEKKSLQRTLTIIASHYYKTGNITELRRLCTEIAYPNHDWMMYVEFSNGNTMKALNERSKMLHNSFLFFYPKKIKKSCSKTLTPEKDLCGEAFNGMFYELLKKDLPNIKITCDQRLHNILSENFKEITFIPKTPPYKQKKLPDKFNKIPHNLGKYLDNSSYKKTIGSEFTTLDYSKYAEHAITKRNRKYGWLSPNEKLREKWAKHLRSNPDIKLIAIASNSTMSSKIRDIHMIGLDHWKEIFQLENCHFININASLSNSDCKAIEKSHNTRIINPGIDLYNDFDNLLAIMSIVDYAVLPANNLMDFAAAVGLKSIIFSPTNIMKYWVYDTNNTYIFSDNIKFIFSEANGNDKEKMVKEAAEILRKNLN